MKPENDYFLPENYIARQERTTVEHASNKTYWTQGRLKTSHFYQFPVYEYALKIIHKHNIRIMADIGCGPAAKMPFIHKNCPELEIYGVDQKSAINFCKNNYDFGHWYVDDFEAPSENVPDFEADLVISADVIEHLLDPDKLLSYIEKKMRKDGLVILSTPDRDRLYGKDTLVSGHPDHVREWNREEFAAYLESRGFKILEHFFALPLKPSLNKPFIRQSLRQIIKGCHLKYNQVCLLQKSNS